MRRILITVIMAVGLLPVAPADAATRTLTGETSVGRTCTLSGGYECAGAESYDPATGRVLLAEHLDPGAPGGAATLRAHSGVIAKDVIGPGLSSVWYSVHVHVENATGSYALEGIDISEPPIGRVRVDVVVAVDEVGCGEHQGDCKVIAASNLIDLSRGRNYGGPLDLDFEIPFGTPYGPQLQEGTSIVEVSANVILDTGDAAGVGLGLADLSAAIDARIENITSYDYT